jgi:hypothetical protein
LAYATKSETLGSEKRQAEGVRVIKPSDIRVSVGPADHYPSQRIDAELRMGMTRFTVSDGSVEVEREQDRCREEIWHSLYGDVARELYEVERVVYPLLLMGGFEVAKEAFGKLRAKLLFDKKEAEAVA